METLRYQPLERLTVPAPVDRIAYITEQCRDRDVLDLGCYDETALSKQGTPYWLHGAVAAIARSVLGVDASEKIPAGGITSGTNSRIVRGDVTALDPALLAGHPVDVVVAGEIIEHLPDALGFLRRLKKEFSGKQLLASTPNATSLTNGLLAGAARESSHHDHLQIYSYKTLNTLCLRAGFEDWTIVPYHVAYTEMALGATGLKRLVVRGAESLINAAESVFPLWAGGLIVHARVL